MSLKRLAIAVAALVVVSAITLGLISGTFGRLVGFPPATSEPGPSATTAATAPRTASAPADGAPSSPSTRTVGTAPPATSSTDTPPADTSTELPRPVLFPAPPGPKPAAATVADRIKAVSSKGVGGHYTGTVVDVGIGKVVFKHRAGSAEIPASVTKLLTSAAALTELGPQHRFTTKVVSGAEKQIILVGGGDPYLAKKSSKSTYPARASLGGLAAQTAAALKKSKQTSVRLGYDDSLFTGPAWNPSWPSGYGDQVTRTSALWVDEGRLAGYSPGPRTSDPSGQAAKVFAQALRKRGIKVTAIKADEAAATDEAIASVRSMSLERIVERVLMASDNDGAEVLFRQVAVAAGRDGSISQARKQLKETLTELGAWHDDTVVRDGSGLSRDNRIGADTLARVLQLAAEKSHPELRALITGLPVAGVEGSLRYRFGTDDTTSARGLVRGKTGTLRRVYSLAGFVRTVDGTLVVYAFIVNGSPNAYAAQTWLDEVTAAVASCGCRN